MIEYSCTRDKELDRGLEGKGSRKKVPSVYLSKEKKIGKTLGYFPDFRHFRTYEEPPALFLNIRLLY